MENLQPQIRFRGFCGDWEKESLSNLAEFSKGRGYSKKDLISEGNPIILYGSLYTDYKVAINNVDTYAKLKRNSVISDGDEVIIPSSGETAEDISVASAVKNPGIIIAGDLNILKSKSIDQVFLALSLSNGKNKKELSAKAEGATISHLKNKDIKEVKLIFPKKEEQEKIGALFEKLDLLIEKQEEYLDLNKRIKRSLLQKLFPKEGEDYPELRFDGFEDKWIKVKFENILEKYGSGGTPNSTNRKYYNGNIPFLSITDITESNGYIYKTDKCITKIGLENSTAWLVPKNSISLAMYASVGKVAILKINAATSQAFFNMIINKDNNIEFIYQYLVKMESFNQWRKLISTGTQSNLNASKIKNFKIKIPSLPEQEKIGSLFKSLDDKIKNEEKKLSSYKNLKKSLLQKMFV